MDYLLKASTIVVIFYVCYKLLLQRETFFASNRWFLLLGLVVASIIPTIVIPIYIEYSPQTFEGIIMTDSIVEQTIENPFDWLKLLLWTYYAGVIFFFGRLVVQFFSLLQLVSSHENTQVENSYLLKHIKIYLLFHFLIGLFTTLINLAMKS